MEIQELWRIATRQWRIVVAATVLALLAFSVWTLMRPTTYVASERLVVSTSGSLGTAVDAQSGEEVAILRVAAYDRLVTAPAFLERVSASLDGRYTAQDLADKVSARSQARIPVIDVSATDTDARTATTIVTAVSKEFTSLRQAIRESQQ